MQECVSNGARGAGLSLAMCFTLEVVQHRRTFFNEESNKVEDILVVQVCMCTQFRVVSFGPVSM